MKSVEGAWFGEREVRERLLHVGEILIRFTLISSSLEMFQCSLSPGVPTGVILQAYASAVESLKILDPSCVIMERVCRSIKEYIK